MSGCEGVEQVLTGIHVVLEVIAALLEDFDWVVLKHVSQVKRYRRQTTLPNVRISDLLLFGLCLLTGLA